MMTKTEGKMMYVGGEWIEKEETINVYDPQDNTLITTVPKATKADMLKAIELAEEGAKIAASMPVHQRISILNKAADYIENHHEHYAETIATEGSKTITEARIEVSRCINTLRVSAEEARRIHGETIPFDQMPG